MSFAFARSKIFFARSRSLESSVCTEIRMLPFLTFYRQPLADLIKPPLDVRKLAEVDIAPLPGCRPRIANHICDGVLAGGEVALLMQAQIHHSVDAMDFVVEAQQGVSLIAVFRILRGAPEVALFAHLGTLVGHLPMEP